MFVRQNVKDSPTLEEIPVRKSNQIEEHYELSNSGKITIVMDHHLVSKKQDISNVVIVNNQTSSSFDNKSLSGAGVVYKVIEAYDNKYNNKSGLYKNFEDLAALGIIADCMDTRTLDNNAIIMDGLKNVNSPLLKAIMEFQDFKLRGKLNKNGVGFYIAPLVNAVIRYGTLEEKEEFFRGFIDLCNTETFHSVSRGNDRYETLYAYLARTASNLRGRQNTQKEKCVEFLSARIEEGNLQENRIIILKVDSEVPSTITGLVAMDIQKAFKRPTLILRPVVENGITYYRGSGRAEVADGFDSFMAVLKESGLMDYVEGHDNAFGASIEKEKIPALIEFCNERLKNIDFGGYNEVNACITDSNFNKDVLMEFAEMTDCYGQGIPEPNFHFKFIEDRNKFTVQGSRLDSLKISHKGVSFVAFNSPELTAPFRECDNFGQSYEVECIGTVEINEFRGYRNLNVMIKEIEITPLEKKSSMLF